MLVCAKGGLTPCLIIAKISALNVTICKVEWHHQHVQRPLCVPRGPLLSLQRDLPTTYITNITTQISPLPTLPTFLPNIDHSNVMCTLGRVEKMKNWNFQMG